MNPKYLSNEEFVNLKNLQDMHVFQVANILILQSYLARILWGGTQGEGTTSRDPWSAGANAPAMGSMFAIG